MRVLYNGLPLLAPRAGVARYMVQLCRALAQADPGWSCAFSYLLGVRSGLSEPPPRGFVLGSLHGPALAPSLAGVGARVIDTVLRVPLRGGGYDLYHETHYAPRSWRGPAVMTVYDLALAFHPETQPKLRVELFRRRFARGLRQMDFFLTITHVGKEELAGEFGVPPARIRVTHLGVDRELFRPALSGIPTGSSSRPILFVGTPEPRKNLRTLLEAYARLPAALRADHPLLLVGPPAWKSAPLWERVRELGLEERVHAAGYVSDATLAELYRGAAALAYPSVYEGFGLPVLEAMACGAPVLCSDTASLAEVAGGAALLLPSGDVEAWTEGLRSVLESEDLRERLARGGPLRAERFTWRRCAERTLDLYRELTA